MASTERDRIIVAQIAGAASRHARTHPLTQAELQGAIAELATVADGRADLLAEHAGLAIGCHEGDLDESHHLRAAQLCIDAGADTSLIPRWIEEGRRRAATAAAKRHRRLTSRPTKTPGRTRRSRTGNPADGHRRSTRSRTSMVRSIVAGARLSRIDVR
jgi:hypothetical protein